jgi:hypothetical protein
MPDDPLDPLDRLADLGPTAEPNDALHVVHRIARRRHRARVTGVAMSLLLILVVTATVVIRRADDERVTTDHGEELPPLDEDGTTTARRGDLEITVTVPGRQLVVGERVPLEVVVRNLGASPAPISELSSCSGSGRLEASEVWGPIVTAEQVRAGVEIPQPAVWNGHTPLEDQLLHQRPLPPPVLGGADDGYAFEGGCIMEGHVATVEPGQTLSQSGSVDVLVGPQAVERATVVVTVSAGVGLGSPDPLLPVELHLPVVDPPSRLRSLDAAVAALAADPRLADYLERRASGTEVYAYTQLAWHFNAWELWIANFGSGQYPLRLRYDPDAHTVVDVREVLNGLPPGDDPNRPDVPGNMDDVVHPLPDS